MLFFWHSKGNQRAVIQRDIQSRWEGTLEHDWREPNQCTNSYLQGSSPLGLQRDLGRLHVGVLPLHLRAVHEVAQGVERLGLPVHRAAGLLVDRGPVAGVLDVQRLQVVHGPGNQVTWRTRSHTSMRAVLSYKHDTEWHTIRLCSTRREEFYNKVCTLLSEHKSISCSPPVTRALRCWCGLPLTHRTSSGTQSSECYWEIKPNTPDSPRGLVFPPPSHH